MPAPIGFSLNSSEDRGTHYIQADHINTLHIYEGLNLLFKEYVKDLQGAVDRKENFEDIAFYVESLRQIGEMIWFVQTETEVL